MFNLTDTNLSYILISPTRREFQILENNRTCEEICTILWSRNYTVFPLSAYQEGVSEKVYLAISPSDDNDDLRFDAINLMEKCGKKSVIVKYKNQSESICINYKGEEKSLNLSYYDSDLSKKCYVIDGVSFSFTERKKYFFPKKKEELKQGMIVEYFNNNKWYQRQVMNVDSEYDKMFKLLMKYEKLRVETI
jgi:hypothetical protein